MKKISAALILVLAIAFPSIVWAIIVWIWLMFHFLWSMLREQVNLQRSRLRE